MKKLIWLTAILLGLLALEPALADTSTATSTGQSQAVIEDGISQLLEAKGNPDLSPNERLGKEITAREKIISIALTLSLKESKTMRDNFQGLPAFATSSQAYAIESGYLANLVAYDAFYKAEQGKLWSAENNPYLNSSDLNDSLKALANEIKDYRETFSSPQIKAMTDFYLAFYTQNSISVARDRLSKISNEVKNLEDLSILQSNAFDNDLSQANALLNEASQFDQNAQYLILTPVDQLNETSASSTPEDLIKSSLIDLSKTYGILLKVGQSLSQSVGQ